MTLRAAVAVAAKALLVAASFASTPAVLRAAGDADDLAQRIERVKTGVVRMTFAARSGVCGDGMSWYRLRTDSRTLITGSFYNSNGGRDVEVECQAGPVRIVVVRADGETREIRTYVGGRWKADTGLTDLGAVGAQDAARWLMTVAENGSERIASSALSAATLADSTDATPALLRIASDVTRPTGVRTSALGWLGEVAGDRVAARLDSIAYEPGDREVRKQAIFAISRRPPAEAYTSLVSMAESLPDRELRKTAVFWLARVKDPRALAWISRQVEK